MSIVHKARRLEAGIARTLERAAQRYANTGAREPLEVMHAIVDAVMDRLEPAGRGRYVFPFNAIDVSIVAAGREDRARFAAVLESEPTLRDRIAARVREAGCAPSPFHVTVSFVTRPAHEWTTAEFHVQFERVAAEQLPPPEASPPRHLQITILQGSADKPSYAFTLRRINLGRCAEVRDRHHRLVRANDVAFSDTAGANDTVSRGHAHIDFVESSRHYRISDDGSAHGTRVVRNGRAIVVPPGSRGVRLESGDEIILGDARARVRIGSD